MATTPPAIGKAEPALPRVAQHHLGQSQANDRTSHGRHGGLSVQTAPYLPGGETPQRIGELVLLDQKPKGGFALLPRGGKHAEHTKNCHPSIFLATHFTSLGGDLLPLFLRDASSPAMTIVRVVLTPTRP